MFKALHLWLPAYLRQSRPPEKVGTRHLLLCVCDHFEPFHKAGKAEALARVERWRREFPRLAGEFRDSGGAHPKQTLFYPIEQHDDDVISAIAELCRASGCEVEIHLHHDRDTAENLRATLEQGKENFVRHGLLSRDQAGAVRYGFVHGNWALDDSHPQGRNCGVPNEIGVLKSTGCYADFTMPSAPHPTQTRIINSIYYATDTPAPKSHDTGVPARVGATQQGDLLIVQGPLGLNRRWRKWGLLPRVENADLTLANPPTLDRLQLWLELAIHVRQRPEWIFVKLHTHGGLPQNADMLLGEPMRAFHRELAGFAAQTDELRFHYVTAREMVNIIHAAEDGKTGDPALFRDYRYRSLIQRNENS